MRIVTKYTSNNNGTGQIIAKANGKQKTVQYDDAHSADWNHGTAAGALLLKGVYPMVEDIERVNRAIDNATHTVNDNGSHTFTI